MNGDVEVGDVGVSSFVEEDIIWLQIAALSASGLKLQVVIPASSPVHYPFGMQIVDSHSYFRNVESDSLLVHRPCAVEVDCSVSVEHASERGRDKLTPQITSQH